MNKARAATVLGGLTMVGMLMLSSLVGANDEQSYFYQLKGAFGRACLQHATQGLPDDIDPGMFRAACSFVVATLKELAPGDGEPEVREALLDAFGEETPGLSTQVTCDVCVQSVQDFESFLATNHTVAEIGDALVLGCQKKFTTQAQLNQCLQNVGAVELPQLVDFILANYPPETTCQELGFCAK